MATMEELLQPPQKRKDPRSELLKAKAVADVEGGEVVNACPFGCDTEHLDANGYCCHLIGFTNDKKLMEPLKLDYRGFRTVQVDHVMDKGKRVPVLAEVPKGSKLIRVTVSYRVYHKDGADPEVLPEDPRRKKSIDGAS